MSARRRALSSSVFSDSDGQDGFSMPRDAGSYQRMQASKMQFELGQAFGAGLIDEDEYRTASNLGRGIRHGNVVQRVLYEGIPNVLGADESYKPQVSGVLPQLAEQYTGVTAAGHGGAALETFADVLSAPVRAIASFSDAATKATLNDYNLVGAGGLVVGAGIGAAVGNVPGAVIGAGLGALVGTIADPGFSWGGFLNAYKNKTDYYQYLDKYDAFAPLGKFVHGFALDVAMDPLTYMTFGVSAGVKMAAGGISASKGSRLAQFTGQQVTRNRLGDAMFKRALKHLKPELVSDIRNGLHISGVNLPERWQLRATQYAVDNFDQLYKEVRPTAALRSRSGKLGVTPDDMFVETARLGNKDIGLSRAKAQRFLGEASPRTFGKVFDLFDKGWDAPPEAVEQFMLAENMIRAELGDHIVRYSDNLAHLDKQTRSDIVNAIEARELSRVTGKPNMADTRYSDDIESAIEFFQKEMEDILTAEQAAGYGTQRVKSYVSHVYAIKGPVKNFVQYVMRKNGVEDWNAGNKFTQQRMIATLVEGRDIFGEEALLEDAFEILKYRRRASLEMMHRTKIWGEIAEKHGIPTLLISEQLHGMSNGILRAFARRVGTGVHDVMDIDQVYSNVNGNAKKLGFRNGDLPHNRETMKYLQRPNTNEAGGKFSVEGRLHAEKVGATESAQWHAYDISDGKQVVGGITTDVVHTGPLPQTFKYSPRPLSKMTGLGSEKLPSMDFSVDEAMDMLSDPSHYRWGQVFKSTVGGVGHEFERGLAVASDFHKYLVKYLDLPLPAFMPDFRKNLVEAYRRVSPDIGEAESLAAKFEASTSRPLEIRRLVPNVPPTLVQMAKAQREAAGILTDTRPLTVYQSQQMITLGTRLGFDDRTFKQLVKATFDKETVDTIGEADVIIDMFDSIVSNEGVAKALGIAHDGAKAASKFAGEQTVLRRFVLTRKVAGNLIPELYDQSLGIGTAGLKIPGTPVAQSLERGKVFDIADSLDDDVAGDLPRLGEQERMIFTDMPGEGNVLPQDARLEDMSPGMSATPLRSVRETADSVAAKKEQQAAKRALDASIKKYQKAKERVPKADDVLRNRAALQDISELIRFGRATRFLHRTKRTGAEAFDDAEKINGRIRSLFAKWGVEHASPDPVILAENIKRIRPNIKPEDVTRFVNEATEFFKTNKSSDVLLKFLGIKTTAQRVKDILKSWGGTSATLRSTMLRVYPNLTEAEVDAFIKTGKVSKPVREALQIKSLRMKKDVYTKLYADSGGDTAYRAWEKADKRARDTMKELDFKSKAHDEAAKKTNEKLGFEFNAAGGIDTRANIVDPLTPSDVLRRLRVVQSSAKVELDKALAGTDQEIIDAAQRHYQSASVALEQARNVVLKRASDETGRDAVLKRVKDAEAKVVAARAAGDNVGFEAATKEFKEALEANSLAERQYKRYADEVDEFTGGVRPDNNTIEIDVVLPKNIAKLVDDFMAPDIDPDIQGFTRKALVMYDRMASTFKSNLLLPFAGTWGRNAFSNAYMASLGGALRTFKSTQDMQDFADVFEYTLAKWTDIDFHYGFGKSAEARQAIRAERLEVLGKREINGITIDELAHQMRLRGVHKGKYTAETLPEGIGSRVKGGVAGAAAGGLAGTVTGAFHDDKAGTEDSALFGNIESVAGLILGGAAGSRRLTMLGRGMPVTNGRRVTGMLQSSWAPLIKYGEAATETPIRVAMFLAEFKETASLGQAGKKTAEYMNDWNALTPFERRVMKRGIPFYSWSKHATAQTFRSVFDEPGAHAATIRWFQGWNQSAGADGHDIPDFYQDKLVMLGAETKEDGKDYRYNITGFGFPIEDVATLAGGLNPFGGTETDDAKQFASAILSRGPFGVTAALERAYNVDTFTGRKIDDRIELTALEDGKDWSAAPKWMQLMVGYSPATPNSVATVSPNIAWLLGEIPQSRFINVMQSVYSMNDEQKRTVDWWSLSRTFLGPNVYKYDKEQGKYFVNKSRIDAMAAYLRQAGALRVSKQYGDVNKNDPNRGGRGRY